MLYNVLLHIALFVVTLRALWKGASTKNLFFFDLDGLSRSASPVEHGSAFSSVLLYSQNVVLFSLVLNSLVLSLTLANPSRNFFENHTYGMKWSRVSYPLIVVGVVCFNAVSFAASDSFGLLGEIPYYVPVLVGCGLVGSVLLHFAMTARQKRWFKKYQLLLSLQFETKLGMYSPRPADGEFDESTEAQAAEQGGRYSDV